MILGITGPTGSGKTTVLKISEQFGFKVIDCDELYHNLLKTDINLKQAIADTFGAVFLPTGDLDRKKLASIVFSNKEELDKLNTIAYKFVTEAVIKIIQSDNKHNYAIDAINLIESPLSLLCNYKIGVLASKELRTQRIMNRDSLTKEQALSRILAQPDDSWYISNCDRIIHTDNESISKLEKTFEDILNNIWRN